MALPSKSDKPYTAWDDYKYGIGFLLALSAWVGGLGYAIIALIL